MINRLDKAIEYIKSMNDKEFEEFLIRNDSSDTSSCKNVLIAYSDLLLSPIKGAQQQNFYIHSSQTDLSRAA